MATRNAKPVTFKEGPDDFHHVMLRIDARDGLTVQLRQNAHESDEVAEASDPVAKLPASALGGITAKQFRATLDALVTHLRGKAGVL